MFDILCFKYYLGSKQYLASARLLAALLIVLSWAILSELVKFYGAIISKPLIRHVDVTYATETTTISLLRPHIF